MDTYAKAREIFDWVKTTQFNIVYDCDGILVSHDKLKDQIKYRAKSYVDFCLSITYEHPKTMELMNIIDEIDKI